MSSDQPEEAAPSIATCSKKAVRQQQRYETILARRRARRKEEKQRRSERIWKVYQDDRVSSKRQQKMQIKERISAAESDPEALKICIDCSFGERMSDKELYKFAGQLNLAWAVIRSSVRPPVVRLCGVDKNGRLYQACVKKCSGFENYLWTVGERSVEDTAEAELVYLSPDSPNILQELSPDKVYVIGGLVDETRKKSASMERAESIRCSTARLPIAEHMQRSSDKGSFNQILAVNQVMQILVGYAETKSWPAAFGVALPKRFGFVQKTEAQSSTTSETAEKSPEQSIERQIDRTEVVEEVGEQSSEIS